MGDRFSVNITGPGIDDASPKIFGASIEREAKAAVAALALVGFSATYKDNPPGRTAANSALLKRIRELYNADIYKKALAVANEQGLAEVPNFMGSYFSDASRDAEVAAMKSVADEDLKPQAPAPRKPRAAKTSADTTNPGAQGTVPTPEQQGATQGSTPVMAQPA